MLCYNSYVHIYIHVNRANIIILDIMYLIFMYLYDIIDTTEEPAEDNKGYSIPVYNTTG